MITNERELVGEIVRDSIAEFGGNYLGYSGIAPNGVRYIEATDFLFQLRDGVRSSIHVSGGDVMRNPGSLLDELVQSRVESAVRRTAA